MVFVGFSLILAVSFLGRQAQAVPHPQGDREDHSQQFQHNLATMTSVSQTSESSEVPPGGAFQSSGDPATMSITLTSSPSTSLAETSVMTSSTTVPTVNPFDSTWSVPVNLSTGESIFYNLLDNPTFSDGTSFDPVLFVLQTLNPNAINSSNTWSVAQIPRNCSTDCQSILSRMNVPNAIGTTIDFLSDVTPGTGINDTDFFFCLAPWSKYIDRLECGSYGPFFKILGLASEHRGLIPRQTPQLSMPQISQLSTPSPPMPATVLFITSFVPIISVSGATITATFPSQTTTATLSIPPTTVATMTITPSATSSSTSAVHHGLSTGAKVGIALGALVLVALLLLAALFFLRRKHRSRSPPPEQVMLTRDMHTDSFASNAIIAEKEAASANKIANASPVDDSLPIQRHSAVQPYDSIPAAPYTGDAASVPRRKPTNASAVSRVSGPASPRSLTVSTPPDEYEEYRDQPMPVYGDARHSPRVYSTEERQGVKAPFLTEEGMSAEDVARLEEEERRIDAAIAEAERSGRRQ
ncbi:hypothetical protein NA56DRAFT_656000 [Hyaloscypha hepaticicola]|uniref:Mid2 domain-containing protein n=1 Tax=Hyaloscypha hepaticicola TaxID=2082293 RepID=A0A2J6QFI7_9HELO|nr:hypothetical protein NA56DRAFT_656000 [Hyaloscypha hepaticicola]